MAIFGSLSTLRAQCAGFRYFDPAFAYLDTVIRPGPGAQRIQALGAGESNRVELADGMFAIEQVYHTKVRTDGLFESHRRFIDVQVVLAGEEIIAVADIARLTVRTPYNEEKDAALYGDFGGASVLQLSAGEAAVFFPVDGHMPSVSSGPATQLVRKTVVKVPVPA